MNPPKESSPKYDYSNLPKWIEDAFVVADKEVEVTQQRNQYDCARCKDNWTCPTLTTEQRKEVAELVRRENMFEPLEFFRLAGFTFVEAKRTMLHITMVPGNCHRCSRALTDESEEAICRCRSLNLNW